MLKKQDNNAEKQDNNAEKNKIIMLKKQDNNDEICLPSYFLHRQW